MRLRAISNKTYSLDHVKNLIKDYEKKSLLIAIARLNAIQYDEDPDQYHNTSQLIPGMCNAALLFAEGQCTHIEFQVFEQLAIMISSLDLPELQDETYKTHIDKKMFQLTNQYDYLPHVHGRVWKIFSWVNKHYPHLEFEKVTSVGIEELLFITFGASSVVRSGNDPFFDPNFFFKETNYHQTDIDRVVTAIDKHFTLTIDEAFKITKEYICAGKEFNDVFSVFEEKPFLNVSGRYYLMVPHRVINDFMSICSSLLTRSFSPEPNNAASTALGKGFETYVQDLTTKVLKKPDFEPSYPNKQKGVDIVYVKKGKIPLFVEISKTTLFKSLVRDYSELGYEEFLQKRVVNKFEQIFKWMKAHNFNYNGIDLISEINRTQFVLCLAQSLPLLNFDQQSELLLRLLNESWRKITGVNVTLKRKNFYILGVHEYERMISISRMTRVHPSLILFQYSKYLSSTKEFAIHADDEGKSIVVRSGFLAWLGSKYENDDKSERDYLDYDDDLMKALKFKFQNDSNT